MSSAESWRPEAALPHKAVLELDSKVVPNEPQKTGVFELQGNLNFTQRTIVDHLLSREFGNLNSIMTGGLQADRNKRAGFYVDMGDGANIFEIEFLGWQGSKGQWGDGSGDPMADATGSNPWHQAQLLSHYVSNGEFDSRGERARLRMGEVSGPGPRQGQSYPDGPLDDYKHVTVKSVNLTRQTKQDMISFRGSIVLAEAEDLTGPIDMVFQPNH